MSKLIFKLDKPKNETSLIMMVYRYGGKKLVLSTSVSIPVLHWNSNTQRIKTVKERPEYITYNKQLDKYQNAFYASMDFFVSNSESPSMLQLKEAILSKVSNKANVSKEYSSNVCKFITQIIESINNKKNETSKVYSQILKNLKAFPTGPQLEFKDLSLARLEEFRDFYIHTPRANTGEFYRRGTIYRHLKHFITIINKAKDHGIKVNDAYLKSSWRIKGPDDEISGNDVVLSDDEIKLLETTPLDERYDRIRDIFLLGLYTGQRYSDYAKLSKDNIIFNNEREYLQVVQKKTKNRVKIPYSEKIKTIFEKYNGYPKSISLQNFNDGIKEVCEIIGINASVIIYYDIPAKGIVEKNVHPKWKFVSTHTARRTFCTNAKRNGVPDKVIMQISGHKSLRTFQAYVRINPDTQLSDDLMFKYFG